MRKHNFEGTIDFFSDEPHIFVPTAFKAIEKEFYHKFTNHNIYIIAKTNRLWFHPQMTELNIKERKALCHFVIQNEYERVVHPWISNVPFDTNSIEVSNFPHREVYLKNAKNDVIRSINALQFLMELPDDIKPDFEVLYVGKSYGRKRNINILDRLFKQHHKKFNEIVIDTMEDSPDKQVVIVALNFILEKRIISTGFNEPVDIPFEADQERMEYLKDIDTNRKYKIDLIEEALINYFSPQYNESQKKSLGKLSSKAIKAFQKLDLSGVVVEFNTRSTGVKLKSDCVTSKKLHMIQFSTFKDKERSNFIDMENLDKSRQMNNDKLLELI